MRWSPLRLVFGDIFHSRPSYAKSRKLTCVRNDTAQNREDSKLGGVEQTGHDNRVDYERELDKDGGQE